MKIDGRQCGAGTVARSFVRPRWSLDAGEHGPAPHPPTIEESAMDANRTTGPQFAAG
ncbi:MAG TPA: hypothetical protein VNO18_10750 [Xanthobacteraceae bacterium]|nr:hypothetical protein [Xanthobacteraceae bacterium]